MLVLSRQRDESIIIGDDVEITVVDIRGDKVRLGITAPRHIQVHRKEVYEAIKRENQQASKIKPQDVPELGERPADREQPKENDPGKNPSAPAGGAEANKTLDETHPSDRSKRSR